MPAREPLPSRRLGGIGLGLGVLVLGLGLIIVTGGLIIGLGLPGTSPGGPGAASSPEATRGRSFPIVAYRGADTLGAETLDFGRLLGRGTPVVLNFWAGQCPPCRAEMPAFQKVYERYADEFLLVGVDIGPFIGLGTRESAIALLDELDIRYPTAYALDAGAVRDNQILSMPTTIFYDGAGAEVARHAGLLTEQAFEARVRELIGAAS